jgi:hypothetical protein
MTQNTGQGCIRLSMLRRLSGLKQKLDIRVPEFCIVPHTEVDRLSNPHVPESQRSQDLLAATSCLPSDRIFARSQPLDESLLPGYSFAGVYQSYAPRRSTPRLENLLRGFGKVLAGRYNRQADYYYSRHSLVTDRPVDLMFSNMVDDVVCFGTAYVLANNCLLTYFDTPVSIFLSDPVRAAARRGQVLPGRSGGVVDLMFRIAGVFHVAIDVEFLIDRSDRIFISQVRPMSRPHLRNWSRVDESVWDEVCDSVPASNTVNTRGTLEGTILDLRKTRLDASHVDGEKPCVYVVSHRHSGHGTSSLDLLDFINIHKLQDLVVVVDHGESRQDDHLQYLMHEDPGIEFLAHTVDVPDSIDGAGCVVTSDGFHVKFDLRYQD